MTMDCALALEEEAISLLNLLESESGGSPTKSGLVRKDDIG
jgi:hypothetical protein